METAAGRLAVREAGTGRPMVFVHGNSCSSRCFDKQLAGGLRTRFRLIALDLPGHGDSPRAADPATTNTLPGYAAGLAAAAAALDAEGAVFVGWSLGGHVVLEASDRLPRAAGYLVFGAPPVASFAEFGDAAFAEPALGAAFRADATDAELLAFAALLFAPGTPVPQAFVEDLRHADPRARAALGTSAAAGALRDERRIVAELKRPLAVVHGAREQLIRRTHFDTVAMPTLWRGAVQELPDAGHAAHWECPERFDHLLGELADACFAHA